MKRIVCYSGGHSSALVAIEVHRRYGPEGLILLNHDIHAGVEHPDVKRFKREIADYLRIPITYANHPEALEKDQLDLCVDLGGFKFANGAAQCTRMLKTEPFMLWLRSSVPDPAGAVVYYGFDANERARIQRRSGIMGALGYRTDYPLALWPRSIETTRDVGVEPPLTYGVWRHANCTGCLKAGKQHWFAVYAHRRDLFEKAKRAEDAIGHSILPDETLAEIEPTFSAMLGAGVEPTERIGSRRFWVDAKKRLAVLSSVDEDAEAIPCECTT